MLELARWAPSGDNTQPWRFEIVDDSTLLVHGFDTRAHCVYDLDGRASQIAQGALLETVRIAATGQELAIRTVRAIEPRLGLVEIEVGFERQAGMAPDPLLPFIATRCTQRRPMAAEALGADAKEEMATSAGPDHEVVWFEGLRLRARFAALMFRNGRLRLTLPEAYPVHRDVIEWGATFSANRIPERAIGVDPATAKLMRWALRSWARVDFMNRYLFGTLVPRLELDLIPGLACAGHFAIFSRSPVSGLEGYLAGGGALQRFWLSAARTGHQVQPEMTPVIFARYLREGVKFTDTLSLRDFAERNASRLAALMPGRPLDRLVFMGRIGRETRCKARSLRLPLSQLMTLPGPA